MKLGETIASRRRIGPLKAVDGAGAAVLGEDFSGAGEKEISVNDGAYAAAAGAMVEIGDGYYYYAGASPDAAAKGFVALKLSVVCQDVVLREEVEPSPQGIPVGTTDPTLLHAGPLRAVDNAGAAVADLTGATIEVSINGGAWQAAGGTTVHIEGDEHDYIPSAAEVAEVGWLAVKLSGTCQEYVFRVDVVAPSSPTVSNVTPTAFSTTYSVARSTPVEFDITGIPSGAGVCIAVKFAHRNETYVALDQDGVWQWPFDAYSTIGDIDSEPVHVSMLPRDGWPPVPFEIKVAAATAAVSA